MGSRSESFQLAAGQKLLQTPPSLSTPPRQSPAEPRKPLSKSVDRLIDSFMLNSVVRGARVDTPSVI
jgi:hypothetical protein